ncbi:MAG TPA: hypothetical protein DCE41_03780 [Cytophagales bacterium]|nr:hypothetical protein [Cytophagales bacterium]HAA21193.1 hypothetical protein [Cytophagales bacterium]HAP62106.1 hypothetical protein [Cytophagales bacterium]
MFRILLITLLILPSRLWSQPANDSIQHRILLTLDGESVSSSTTGATVEWDCVDESLTGKCIQYHNDQWFSFIPQSAKTIYLNLFNQNCRDQRGVQVAIFTGEPCQPHTYIPWVCYSTGTREDIYLSLDSLQPGIEYLVNLDGYLNDGCSFGITLSTTPRGMPAFPKTMETTKPEVVLDSLLLLRWTLPDPYASEIEQFTVLRRSVYEATSSVDREIPIAVNSVGEVRRNYGYLTTLPTGQGAWVYQVWAMPSQGDPVLVGTYQSKRKYASSNYWEGILYYPEEEHVTLKLYGPETGKVLKEEAIVLDEGYAQWSIPLNGYRSQGVPFLGVKVYNSAGQLLAEYFHSFW